MWKSQKNQGLTTYEKAQYTESRAEQSRAEQSRAEQSSSFSLPIVMPKYRKKAHLDTG